MQKGKLSLIETKFWQQEASSCVERQKIELIKKNNYPLLVNYYEGVQSVRPDDLHVNAETQSLIISEYFPNTNALISEIMYQNPDILIDAMKPSAEDKVPLMKSALGYFFRKSEALIENRVALFDMIYAGYCAVEVDQIPNDNRPPVEMQAPEQEKPKGMFDKAVSALRSIVTPEDAEKNYAQQAPQMEANFSTVQGTYLRRYDPLDVPLDWRAERVRDRRYNLKKVWMSKAEFDAKYPDFKDLINVEDEKFGYSKHGIEIHNRKVLLYEFQIRLRGDIYRTIIISPNYNMREIDTFDRPYKTNGFNMKIGTLHKYGKLYSRSIAQINKKMQDEMNEYVNHLMEVAERNIPKRLYDKNKVKQDGLEVLMNTKINDMAPVDGNPQGAVTELQPTNASMDNKELLGIFQEQKSKLWSVSESRLAGNPDVDFAEELKIQEQGFESRQIDIQEGLRQLIKEELDTGKDLICNFWDDKVFLKITGTSKEAWYTPTSIPDPNNPMQSIVANPLTDELRSDEDTESLGDFEIDIDIASAAHPNRAQQLARMLEFMTQLVSMRQILIEQGKDINVDEIKRISKEFGWNPDKLFVDHQPAMVPSVPTASGEIITPEENAMRQAEAEARVG